MQSASEWFDSVNAAIAAIRSAGAIQQDLGAGYRLDWGMDVEGIGKSRQQHQGGRPRPQFRVRGPPVSRQGWQRHTQGGRLCDGGVERITEITQWAETTGNRLFLGEVGVWTDNTSLDAFGNMLTYIQQHTDVWEGVTYWAGGPWWPKDYIYLIEPENGVDKPQMTVLLQHLKPTTTDIQYGYAAITGLLYRWTKLLR